MSKNSLHEKFLNIWSVAHKFSGGNSKITKKIENYIRANYLSDTFSYQSPSGKTITQPVFELAEPRKGKQTPYFNPLAMNSFIAQRGAELKEKASEFEQECPTIALRVLRRQLGLAPSKEKELLKFIETKCLHDTFQTQDESGLSSEELIFDYPMDSHSKTYLTIQKNGIKTFVLAHQNELKLLGAKNIDMLIGDIKPFKKEEGLLQQSTIFRKLKLPNQMRSSFNQLFFNQMIHQKNEETGAPLFFKRQSRQKIIYCLKEEALPILVQQNKQELQNIGLTQSVIDHFLNEIKIERKTDEMITLSEFIKKYLHSHTRTSLLSDIRQNHLNDTYQTQDETGKIVQRPIFIKVGGRKEIEKNYVFASQEALFAFASQNKELFKKHGVTDFQYNNIFRKLDQNIPQGEAILVHDLSSKYHFFGREHFYKIASFVGETYQSRDENGHPQEKPLIFMKRQKSGHLRYYILKEAILTLLTRHKKDLMVQETTFKAILKNKPILPRTNTMLSIENLAEFLNYPTHFYPKISKLIETSALHEKHLNPATNKECDTFVYAACQSGKNSLMIEASGVKDFINKYKNNLLSLGIPLEDITKAIQKATNDPNYYQEFVLKRRLRQDKFNEQARLKKERTKE